MYQYRARYYHAQLGRFINRDPIEYDAGGYNLYEYVGSCPLTSLDPWGLKKEEVPALTDDEKAELKDCGPCSTREGGASNRQLGWVECDGKGGMRPKTKPKKELDKLGGEVGDAYYMCDLDDCTKAHESHHILQTDHITPGVCKDQPAGAIVQIDGNCKSVAECRATQVEYECLQKLIDKYKKKDKMYVTEDQNGNKVKKKCSSFVEAYMKSLPGGVEKQYKCSEHKIDITQPRVTK